MSFKPEPPDTLADRRPPRATRPGAGITAATSGPAASAAAPSLLARAGPFRLNAAAVAAGLLIAAYAVLLATLLRPGADNLRLAAVFSTDEALSGEIVRHMLDARTLSPSHFFAYGAVLHEIAALLALIADVFTGRDTAVLLGLRAAALAGGVATLALTYLMGARLFSPASGLVAVALLALSAEQARWSVTAHPDTLVAAFTTAGLLAVVRLRARPTAGAGVVAGACAGLAFATKYGGVLLLPAIVLACWAGLTASGAPRREVARGLVRTVLVAGCVFAAVFAVTNPYALVEWRRSIPQVRAEVAHAAEGHVTRASDPAWRWLTLLGAPGVLGAAVLLLAPLGWLGALLDRDDTARRKPLAGRIAAHLDAPTLVALWTVASLALLLVAVGYQEARYALPLFPPLCVFAAGGVAWLARGRRALTPALAAAVLILTAARAAGPLSEVREERLGQRLDARLPSVAAGLWLQERLTPEAVLLTDAYVYVPPRLLRGRETFGLTAAEVEAQRPVVIVVNEAIRGRFRAADGGRAYVDGPAAYEARRAAYEALESGRLGCYILSRDFGGVAVYADAAALASGAQHGCGVPRTGG